MHIVEFVHGTLRFLEHPPVHAPAAGFVWIYLEREQLDSELATLQHAAQHVGGSPLLDLHVKDLANRSHPSQYDYTSVYDLVLFRRLATKAETAEAGMEAIAPGGATSLASFGRVETRAVGFVVFDRLLITVHPAGCFTATTFIERFLAEAAQNTDAAGNSRSRLPASPADLMLRMLNVMVDSYLDLRKQLAGELDRWQQLLLQPRPRGADWAALMAARQTLHTLEDLCEEQRDAMQEWLDAQQEQPVPEGRQAERDSLMARARDVVEHVDRVMHHVRRMEQGAETAVQIHFSAQGQRTNETMRVLTALTAVFLPLNLITGFFGMNFEFLPLIHSDKAMWIMLGLMVLVAVALLAIFWRKRYLARSGS
jgi:magnesium transporter